MLLLLALLSFPAQAQSSRAPDAAASSDPWQDTLEDVVPAVVSIKVVGTRSFDTESAGSSVGTGFVVDAERGIILTNRHMVHAGPVVAEAVFLNNEEVPLQALYRDPVHDFGFYQFDPQALRFMELKQLPLNPEGAEVGTDIRVVGNDSGEKVVILDGTLARLDRSAPSYGGNTYNDFNTFYFQAGSSTSGGSSGSPVVNQAGEAIALNAGGKRSAASSFYLPLDRVVRALELIQNDQPVARGTLQAVFQYTPYDELRRLGLSDADEAALREAFPEGEGALVVSETLPQGPAWDKLQPGDILLAVSGTPNNAFIPLEAALDDAVGGELILSVSRNGQRHDITVQVQDLHSVTPDRFLSFGGGILHPLSYQQARNHALPVQGLYVATPGYALGRAGVPDGAVITAVDGTPVTSLPALEQTLVGYADGDRIPVRYFAIDDPRSERVAVMRVDRTWTRMQICVRDDETGLWPCTASPDAPSPSPPEAMTVNLSVPGPKPVRALAPSMVKVTTSLPVRAEGAAGSSYWGAGLVVDAERGWVICDRDTVPILLGDVSLTFASTHRVPAEVVFVHPEQNLVVLQYDPALLGETVVVSAEFKNAPLETGDGIWQVGMTGDGKIVGLPTTVGRIDPVTPDTPRVPQFRASNVEVADVTDTVPTVGGVLCDKKGRVMALWSSFHSGSGRSASNWMGGTPVYVIEQTLAALEAGHAPRGLGAQLSPVALSSAKERGLPAELATDLATLDPERRQALMVTRVAEGTPAWDLLQPGDLVVTAEGVLLTRIEDLTTAAQAETVSLQVVRDGELQDIQLPTVDLGQYAVDDLLIWNGLVLHEPHWELMSQKNLSPEGVYVGLYYYGSPAQHYGIRATNRIIAVGDTPTPDLDSFQAAVQGLENGEAVKITMKDLEDQTVVRTMKVDAIYWGTARFVWKEEEGWVRAE